MGSKGPALRTETEGRSKVGINNRSASTTDQGASVRLRHAFVTFIFVRAAPPHVIEDGEVGGWDGVGAATAVATATAQAAPWGSLCVNAAGTAAALRRDGQGRTVPIWYILWLLNKRTNEVRLTTLGLCVRACVRRGGDQRTHDCLILFWGVLDCDALNLLVEALHAVAETRSWRLGYRDGYQDGFGHRRLQDTKTPCTRVVRKLIEVYWWVLHVQGDVCYHDLWW